LTPAGAHVKISSFVGEPSLRFLLEAERNFPTPIPRNRRKGRFDGRGRPTKQQVGASQEQFWDDYNRNREETRRAPPQGTPGEG
jgi:hypothetical protein